MIAFHINSPSYGKSNVEVSTVSTVPVDVLRKEVAQAIISKYPNTSEVHLAKNASSSGIAYSNSMIVAYGSTSGLPEFAEIIQMCVINEELFLIVNVLCGWYSEHYRAFELSSSPSRETKLVALSELTDTYPLADYMVGSRRMVTLKRHIIIKGWLTTEIVPEFQMCTLQDLLVAVGEHIIERYSKQSSSSSFIRLFFVVFLY